ncbi:hypothetical protein PRZ48_001164 [Zasmidium cellare]|uniref:Uncharacterized protein n=1 Tax=Zasmidium cellare TaxID=395010 RepID=A0ABR0F0H4_ZASCE|nr:hypothetical protein PRZ48_001164 [Zasmidium cellare]
MSTVDAQPPPSHHHHDPHHPTAPQLDTTNTQKPAGSSSPVAPAYSPITPKVQPVLPATVHAPFVPAENGGNFTFSPGEPTAPRLPQLPQQPPQQPKPSIAPTEYIPQPPNLPFSSKDATDAIALRAAISTLQFQKMKAKDDLKTLESIKQLALDDPKHFKTEFAAGRLNESRPKLGDLRAILDEDDDDDDEDEEEEEVKLGASREDEGMESRPADQDTNMDVTTKKEANTTKSFPRIPGPQSVVRMPPVNWDKYGIVGEPLENMHAQQRRWPGSTSSIGQDKGREHTIAAPYSPWLDHLDPQQRAEGDTFRKDSGAASSTPPGTISEHPMETRSRG